MQSPASSPDPRFCPNCSAPMQEQDRYCRQCGQRYSDGRVTFGELIREFVDAVFNFDSKIFRTLAALLVPGKLTREYFQGRHRTYLHPIRIFLVLTVLFMAMVAFNSSDVEVNLGSISKYTERDYLKGLTLAKFDTVRNELPPELLSPETDRAIDTLEDRLRQKLGKFQDTVYINSVLEIFQEDSDLNPILLRDMYELEPEELYEKYEIDGFFERLSVQQVIRFMKRSGNFMSYLLGKISWMILLMMPFLALVLKLLYIRRGYYYVEHLIFSFHTHSFVFLIGSIGLLVGHWANEGFSDIAGLVIVVACIVYLWLSLKRVYRQGWFKTSLKFLLANLFYLVLFTFFLIITLILGFFLF
ncbi:MAG: DUF3667 domain-containing protein [Saprospiraceae bacterium]|nr:DUF3667 domain-containing protein [Saprospiraceae bacterium]MCB0679191.1 DUF3667 domain-containing protein [Saprospiraceae bacterium]